ncbi:bypass of stop codon protein 6 [Trichomonascus vanleenenianus]|uniref:bypass of stop codon protein 6 n=1 Tax=Trichomonascus vanleenenianus TaxID=2268995 RepID=UPI003ECA5C5A
MEESSKKTEFIIAGSDDGPAHHHCVREKAISLGTRPSTDTAHSDQPRRRWNDPKVNTVRLAAAFFAFFVSGLKDSAIGLILPTLQNYYNINYFVASIAFASPVVGFIVSALTNDRLHRLVGRRGVVIIGACSQLTFFIIAACAPPFPLFVVANALAGYGSGIIEATNNTFCATMERASAIMGLLHSCYGVGGIVLPAVGQVMLSHGVKWHFIYLIHVCFSVLSLTFSGFAFWGESPQAYKAHVDSNDLSIAPSEAEEVKPKQRDSFSEILHNGMVWMLAVLVFLYVGAEVSTGGWTTSYMISERHANRDTVGYITTGFWGGITLGRLLLGYIADRYVKNLSLLVLGYIVASIAISLVYWLVPEMIVTAVFVGLLGFVLGPLYPSMMTVAATKLPKRLHVAGLSLPSSFGGAGAGALPFVCGALAQQFGVWSIAPLIFSAFCVMTILWSLIMKLY